MSTTWKAILKSDLIVCLVCPHYGVHYSINCIYILPFLEFEDTSFANFASTSHVFDNMRMLLIEILHPLLALSMPCGCSPSKFCIFNFRKSTIADIVARYPLSSIYCSIRLAIQTASGSHLLLRLLMLSNQYQFLRNS